MKSLKFLILGASILLISCKSSQSLKFESNTKISKMSSSEIENLGIRTDSLTIFTKDTIPVAFIQSYEYECYKGSVITEISVTVKYPYYGSSGEIMRYVYTKHPRAKIEINYDNQKMD